MSKQLIEQISESQDGNPLLKFTEGAWNGDSIVWAALDDNLGAMSVCDALNLLLLKIASSQTPADDMDYVQRQLSQAALVVFKHAIAEEVSTQ